MTDPHDEKRQEEQPWRRWYGLKAWAVRRRIQLAKVPWCEPCLRLGRKTKANTANHIVPHRGDWKLFISGKLESACAECHSTSIQAAEIRGFRTTPGKDGWPADPSHPFNKRSA